MVIAEGHAQRVALPPLMCGIGRKIKNLMKAVNIGDKDEQDNHQQIGTGFKEILFHTRFLRLGQS